MINDLISKLIQNLDNLLINTGLYTKITELIGYLDDYQSYTTEFHKYLSGVYFVFGKPLVMYIIGVFVVIVVIRILFAVINLLLQIT